MPTSFPQSAPIAPQHPARQTYHGVMHQDEYAWLRAENWRDAMQDATALPAEIRQYLEKENKYTESFLSDLGTFPEQLVKQMRARIKENDTSPPYKDGAFWYFSTYREGDQHPQFKRYSTNKTVQEADLILDGQALYETAIQNGQLYFDLGDVCHSPCHQFLAFCTDVTGDESYRISIRDLDGTTRIEVPAQNATDCICWSKDSRYLYFVVRDENLRPCAVQFFDMQTRSIDTLYEEQDPCFFVDVSISEDHAWLLVSSHNHDTSEIWVLDFTAADHTLLCLARRREGHQYDVARTGQGVFITSNKNGALDFALYHCADKFYPTEDNWHVWQEHKLGHLIKDVVGFDDFLVQRIAQNGRLTLCVTDLRTTPWGSTTVPLNNRPCDIRIDNNNEFYTSILRFVYSTMAQPEQTIDYNMRSGERHIVKTQEIPCGHHPEDYIERVMTAHAPDGTQVPVSLLYHRQTNTAHAPCLLYGYAAYGHAISPGFSANRLSLVNRGFVYAIAHCRGGTEKGYSWYHAGKGVNKTNSFHDFITVADMLITAGYAAPDQIIAHGASAGGMLVAAAANMAPGLFLGVIAQVPFVDCLTTMLDESLPLTPPEWPEWGNPIEDRAAFLRIKSYAPYENIQNHPYPAIFATAGLADARVTYWEPAKWIARLRRIAGQQTRMEGRDFYLHTDMTSGHGGASGRLSRLEDTARIYAFALALTGMTDDANATN